MPTKRIYMSDTDEKIFNQIKKKENITTEELISKMIYFYDEQKISQLTNEIEFIKESVLLLIKGNPHLPSANEPDRMFEYVNKNSRFNDLITRKVMKND